MFSFKSVAFKIGLVATVFALSTLGMFYLSIEASKILQSEAYLSTNETLGFPRTIEDVKNLSSLLKASYAKHSKFIFILYCSAFLYKQSFAIPGSVLLNLLAGSLFGLYNGLLICAFLTTAGALCCFFLSKLCGESVVKMFFEKKLIEIRKFTNEQGTYSLLSYLISIRLFPATPNWLINILCPILGVPWYLFAISCYVGLIPYIYLCVQTGQLLSELTSTREIFTTSIVIKSTTVALAALLPNFFMKRLKLNDLSKTETTQVKSTNNDSKNKSSNQAQPSRKNSKKKSKSKKKK